MDWLTKDYSNGRSSAFTRKIAGLAEVTYDPERHNGRFARSLALEYRMPGVRKVHLVKVERVMIGSRVAVRRTYTVDGYPL